MTRLIIDAETDETAIVELTAEELADLEIAQNEAAERIAAKEAKEAAKATVLAKLGLTAEELAALI